MTPHAKDYVGVEVSIFFTRKFLDVGLKFVSGEQVGIGVQGHPKGARTKIHVRSYIIFSTRTTQSTCEAFLSAT